jgi:hypothetical protein
MGVNGKPGASLRAWREYFPKPRYMGPISTATYFAEDRIGPIKGTEGDKGLWQQLDGVLFDVMIDDGFTKPRQHLLFMNPFTSGSRRDLCDRRYPASRYRPHERLARSFPALQRQCSSSWSTVNKVDNRLLIGQS